MNWLENFDERQQKEIEFSRVYAGQFRHGTDGHNAKLIIAKMSSLLDGVGAVYDSNDTPERTRDRLARALELDE